MARLIAILPVASYSLLRALSAHLIRIVQNASVNKMTIRNVGIVFSPTLSIPAGVFSMLLTDFEKVFNVDGSNDEDGEADGDGAETLNHTTSAVVEKQNGKEEDSDNDSLEDYGEVIAPSKGKERVRRPVAAKEKAERKANMRAKEEKVSKRNSMIYANTSADQMLGLGGRKLEG